MRLKLVSPGLGLHLDPGLCSANGKKLLLADLFSKVVSVARSEPNVICSSIDCVSGTCIRVRVQVLSNKLDWAGPEA